MKRNRSDCTSLFNCALNGYLIRNPSCTNQVAFHESKPVFKGKLIYFLPVNNRNYDFVVANDALSRSRSKSQSVGARPVDRLVVHRNDTKIALFIAMANVVVARRGSDAFVRLAYTKEARGLSGSSELQLELTRIIIDGREFPVVSGDYTMKGKGRGGDTAKKVGGGAIVGAIIGGVAGGGTGAAIGAGVGGAAGAGAEILTRGRAVRVPTETLLEFRLDQPVTVTPTQR